VARFGGPLFLRTRQQPIHVTYGFARWKAASVMTPDRSKKLKIGQRVAWHDSATDQGTVTASDWSGVRIAWDNGKDQFFHHNNMTEVDVARTNLQ